MPKPQKMDLSALELMPAIEKNWRDKAEAEQMLLIMGVMMSMSSALPAETLLLQAEVSVDAIRELTMSHTITRSFDPTRKVWLYEVRPQLHRAES